MDSLPTALQAFDQVRPHLSSDFELCAIYSGTGLQIDGSSSEWMFVGRNGQVADLTYELDENDRWHSRLRLRRGPAPGGAALQGFPDSPGALERALELLGVAFADLDDRANLSARDQCWRLQAHREVTVGFGELPGGGPPQH